MPYPSLLHPEPLPLQQSTADPYLLRRHSNTVLSQSLSGLWVLVCIRYVWTLWASQAGKGFDSKWDFSPPTVFVWLLLCPWGNLKVSQLPLSVFRLAGASQTLDMGCLLIVTTLNHIATVPVLCSSHTVISMTTFKLAILERCKERGETEKKIRRGRRIGVRLKL